MDSVFRRLSATAAGVLATVLINTTPAVAGVVAYTDRAAFLAVVGGAVSSDGFETYAPGAISNNSTLGDFKYTFADTVLPMVVPGGFGGQALGGPFDVFVGGDSVSLTYGGATALRAFGVDVLYAPSFDSIAADLYRLQVGDGASMGFYAGSPVLDSAGGMFFLGLVADSGSEFSLMDMLSIVPLDANGDPALVSAYQFDDIAYAVATTTPVPEPSTLAMMLAAGALMAVRRLKVR
jgi:hypothetical protein